jgi:hypothetical protein
MYSLNCYENRELQMEREILKSRGLLRKRCRRDALERGRSSRFDLGVDSAAEGLGT